MVKLFIHLLHDEFISKLMNVKLCWNSLKCHKHEVLLGCPYTTKSCSKFETFRTYIPSNAHRKYLMFTSFWSQGMNTRTLSITFLVLTYKFNGICFYNKSFGNQEMFAWYFPYPWPEKIWHMPPHSPKLNNSVIIRNVSILKINVWINLFNYLSLNFLFIMICQHIMHSKINYICDQIWNHNNTKISAWSPNFLKSVFH